MILEIRRYDIEAGRRAEFVEFFDGEVLPAMTEVGIRIVGQFVSVEDETTFYFLRAFDDEAQRAEQSAAFYESEAWLESLKERALDMETGFHVDVVTPTPRSQLS